jgi:hypothetical protein
MSKQSMAALASLLVGASLTFGQGKDLPPASMPEPVAAPMANGVWEGPKVPLSGEPDQATGAFSFDADLVLWFYGTARDNLDIASSTTLATSGVTILGTQVDVERRENLLPGGRFRVGYWQVEESPWVPGGVRDLGVETVIMFVPQTSADFFDGRSPNLVRPFFDINNRQETAFFVASPGIATGNINAHGQANVWGAEANVWKNLYYNFPGTSCIVDVMGGFRYMSGDEQLRLGSLSIFNSSIPADSPFASFAGNTLDVRDSFTTHNRFYGGQIGIQNKTLFMDGLFFDLAFKLAFGVTDEELNIVGNQVRTFADGTTAVSTGGLFALPSNIGHFHRDKFTLMPELDLKFGYAITDHLTFTTAFSAIYWDRFLRASRQLDRQIDITQIPNFPGAAGATPTGLGTPGVLMRQDDLWVMGVSIGLEFQW